MESLIRQKAFKNVLIVFGAYLALILVDIYDGHQHHGTVCIFKNVTGYPCAGCGLGRATLAFFYGDWEESFHYNVLGIPLTLFALFSMCWLLYDAVKKKNTYFSFFDSKITWRVYVFFLILTLANWGLNIYRGI